MNRIKNRGFHQWLLILVSMLSQLGTEGAFVNITYVDSAAAKGAVCLDGSPPAYNLDKGSGDGSNNWLVHIEGGGWCQNVTDCLGRSKTFLGSSKFMAEQDNFSGVLSNEALLNPDFYSWNRVKIRYCDGGSFTGDIEEVDSDTKVHYRGAMIFLAVMVELLEKGMRNAENAILSGTSAGGLASILHCDNFRSLLPQSTKVKCLADAGFFINAKDITGARYIEDYYNDVVTTHGSAKNLPESCTSKMKPSLCFFAENTVQGIQTPLFILNSAIDYWQISNILAPDVSDPHGLWKDCKSNITKCSASQHQKIQGFEQELMQALFGLGVSRSRGYFIDSCFLHGQTEEQEYWFEHDSPRVNHKTVAEAVGDWYNDRNTFQEIECLYPCEKSCPYSQSHPQLHMLA